MKQLHSQDYRSPAITHNSPVFYCIVGHSLDTQHLRQISDPQLKDLLRDPHSVSTSLSATLEYSSYRPGGAAVSAEGECSGYRVWSQPYLYN